MLDWLRLRKNRNYQECPSQFTDKIVNRLNQVIISHNNLFSLTLNQIIMATSPLKAHFLVMELNSHGLGNLDTHLLKVTALLDMVLQDMVLQGNKPMGKWDNQDFKPQVAGVSHLPKEGTDHSFLHKVALLRVSTLADDLLIIYSYKNPK